MVVSNIISEFILTISEKALFVAAIGRCVTEFVAVLQVQDDVDHNKLFSKFQFNMVKLVDSFTMALKCHSFFSQKIGKLKNERAKF